MKNVEKSTDLLSWWDSPALPNRGAVAVLYCSLESIIGLASVIEVAAADSEERLPIGIADSVIWLDWIGLELQINSILNWIWGPPPLSEMKQHTPRIRFEKLCHSYALRILKFKENHAIKKAYIEQNDKDKDELATSSCSSSKNSTIRHLLQPKTQLLSLVSRV